MDEDAKDRWKSFFKTLVEKMNEDINADEFSGAIPLGDDWYWMISIKKGKLGTDGDNE